MNFLPTSADEDVAAPMFNGMRMDTRSVDLDAAAQGMGFLSFSDMQSQDPIQASLLQRNAGGGQGDSVQAADHDALNMKRIAALIGMTAMPYNTGGAAFGAGAGAAGGGVAPSLATAGIPMEAGLPGGTLAGGAAIPGATTMGGAGAAEAASAVGGAGGFGSEFGATGPATMHTTAAGDIGSSLATGTSTAKRIADLAKVGAAGIGGATKAAAANRGSENDFNQENAKLGLDYGRLGLSGYEANTSAGSALQNQLMGRAKLEQDQRAGELHNLFKQSVAHNLPHGPNNHAAPMGLSPEFLGALDALAKQGGTDLATGPTYDARTMKAPDTTRVPYTAPPFTLPAWKKPSTMETAGDWLGPILAGVGAFA